MGNLPGWKMIDAATGDDVKPDEYRNNFRGESYTLLGVTQAPDGNSSGRVAYHDPDWPYSDGVQYVFPAVFDVNIVPDVTVPDTPAAAEQRPPALQRLLDNVAEELTKAGITGTETHGIGVSVSGPAPVCERCANDPVAVAVRKAMGQAADVLQPVFADLFAELATTAYYAGLDDGKAGKDGPDRLHCALDSDTESGD